MINTPHFLYLIVIAVGFCLTQLKKRNEKIMNENACRQKSREIKGMALESNEFENSFYRHNDVIKSFNLFVVKSWWKNNGSAKSMQ